MGNLSVQEASLIEQSKSGNIESFEQLVISHQKKMFNIAFRMLGNLEDANDVTQEALIKAYRGINSFNGKSSFSTWLYTIVNNASIDFIRKNKKNKTVYLDREYESAEGTHKIEVACHGDTPEEVLEKKEVRRVIEEAIKELSEDHRRIIVLRDIEQFTYAEIAQILDCSEGTVKSRINRARKILKVIIMEKLKN